MSDAIRKAAIEAAAKESYKEACRDAGVKPTAWTKLDAKVKARHMKRAEEALAPAPAAKPAPAPASGPPPVQTPPPVTGGPFGGAARVEERDEEPEDFNPEFTHVVLDVTRGNLRHPIKLPVNVLAPDIATVMPRILEHVRDAMFRAQQQGGQARPTQPVAANGRYALAAEDKVWTEADRLRLRDFTGTWEDEKGQFPCLEVHMVDVGEPARTAPVPGQAGGNVGLGNPVFIGTQNDDRGRVLGVPVAGGQPQPQAPPQAQPEQARVGQPLAPHQHDPSRARV